MLWLHAGAVLNAAAWAAGHTATTGEGLVGTFVVLPVAALALWIAVSRPRGE